MLKSLNAVVFDFDGVIVQSMENNLKAWIKVFTRLNIQLDNAEYYQLEGMVPAGVARYFLKKSNLELDDDKVAALVNLKEKFYREGRESQLYPGIKEFLQLLQKNRIKIGLVSGGAHDRIMMSLKKHKIQSFFDSIVSANSVTWGKPHPEPFLKSLAELECNPYCAIAIENAPLGIRSAKAAGLKVIAIGSTLREKDLVDADYFCSNHEIFFQFFIGQMRGPE